MFIKAYNSITIKVTPPNFQIDLYYVAISMVCKLNNIWLRQTKIRERIPTFGKYGRTNVQIDGKGNT